MSLPTWMDPIISGADRIAGSDISAFLPPEDHDGRHGAVLVLFGEGPHGPDLLLTERAHSMRSHPGQISFPGGAIDPEDQDAVAAALREAEEETGLDPHGVEVVAHLPQLWLPPTNFAVTPVMGWWRDRSDVWVQDPSEVEQVLQVPLSELIDPAYRVMVKGPRGYSSPGWWIGPEKDLILWGFTAGVINKLFDFVGMTEPWDTSVEVELPRRMLERP